MERQFDWNPAKAVSNLEKRRIAFEDAITVFVDPARVEVNVTKLEHGEVRYMVIGRMRDGRMTTVIYTDRANKLRIISARQVRKNEQREYNQRKAVTGRQGRSDIG